MRLAAILILALLVTGCASTQHSPSTPIRGSADSVVKTQVYITDATELLAQLSSHVLPTGVGILNAAVSKLALGAAENLKSRDGFQWWADYFNTNEKEKSVLKSQLAAERNQWFGDRLWNLWYWVVGIWLGLGILSMIVGGFFCTGPLAWITSSILRFLPFANLFIRGRDIIRARGGKNVVVRDAMGSLVAK